MSAALAGTSAATVMTPAAANTVQCIKGSLHVCGPIVTGRKATDGSGLCAQHPGGGFVGLKNALDDGFGCCRCPSISEVPVSHKRRMSPFYKRFVTVT